MRSFKLLCIAALLLAAAPLFAQSPKPAAKPRRNDGSRESIDAGLAWLVKQQQADGSWSIKNGPDPGRQAGTVAATSMALIPLLRAGNTETEGTHKEAVRKGLAHLTGLMKPDGDLREGDSMYVHGLATIALCEAVTKDRKFEKETQAAVDFIIKAQDPKYGGWRYQPLQQPGDTSVLGWQLTALQLAKDAKLTVPAAPFELADKFLIMVQTDGGASYGYTGPGNMPGTSAIGLYHRLPADAAARTPPLAAGIKKVAALGPSEKNLYFTYYATQLMKKAGGEDWNGWRKAARASMAAAQEKGRTPQKGSWHIEGQSHGEVMGRLGETSFALMILLVE